MNTNFARKWQAERTVQPKRQTKEIQIKVRKKKWLTKGELFLYTLAGLCFICLSLYIVSYSSSNDRLNRDVIQLESKIQEQQLVNENLTLEVKEYSRPERIIETAKKAGLKPQNGQVKQASRIE